MINSINSNLVIDGKKIKTMNALAVVYRERIAKYGFSGQTFLYFKEDQHSRKINQYATLLRGLVTNGDRLMDVGCGYGDLVPWLSNCNYFGIDMMVEFIAEARRRHPSFHFEVLALEDCRRNYDWCTLLGVVNSVPCPEKLIQQAWEKCTGGLLVDFIDKNKYRGGLNRFDLRSCVENFAQMGAMNIEIYPTDDIWTIFVVKKRAERTGPNDKHWTLNRQFRTNKDFKLNDQPSIHCHE